MGAFDHYLLAWVIHHNVLAERQKELLVEALRDLKEARYFNWSTLIEDSVSSVKYYKTNISINEALRNHYEALLLT